MNTNPTPVTTTSEEAQEVAAVRAPVAVATSDAERAAFEDWAGDEFKTVHRKGAGYKERDVQGAWCGFKHARSLARAAAALPIDFKQATELLAMFGGEPGEVTLLTGEGHSGRGLYAHYSDYPEEGAEFLGVADDEAVPGKQATDQGGWQPVAVPLVALHLIEDAAQAHDQCRAVVHMALSLAEVYVARAAILAHSPDAPIALIGESSAATMEYLGDLLSSMDAVEEGDAWLDPIFEAAHARWPLPAAPTLLGVADGDAVGGKSGGAK